MPAGFERDQDVRTWCAPLIASLSIDVLAIAQVVTNHVFDDIYMTVSVCLLAPTCFTAIVSVGACKIYLSWLLLVLKGRLRL
eukprot:364630-Chlamydomonas_euryale.AAC.24